ncbi:MAG: zinc ribbon-containing protein [Chloroflexi bacterium]|nr:zinc ribbon-containing protein [Chloroflexota bacterium]
MKFINIKNHEDVSDFADTALECKQCKHQMRISGPLPKNAKCSACGSTNVVRKNGK